MPIIKQEKKMVKHEAKFHAQLMKWLKYNLKKFPKSFLIETKVVRPDSKNFSFRELSEKEERLLYKAKHKAILQTHSDLDRMGTNCDGACISGGGFIFLYWVRPKNKTFYCIDIERFIESKNKFKTSLTEEQAKNIAMFVEEFK